jgi:hypothetical protein
MRDANDRVLDARVDDLDPESSGVSAFDPGVGLGTGTLVFVILAEHPNQCREGNRIINDGAKYCLNLRF